MTYRESEKRSIGGISGSLRRSGPVSAAALILCVVMLLSCVAVMSGCSASDPEKAVREELEAYRTGDRNDQIIGDLEMAVDDSAKEDFGTFMDKVGDFDYKITDVETGEDGTAAVTVRITTYSFGREYLSTWTEFFEAHGDGVYDEAEFYGLLMKNLSRLELKTFDSTVKITCVETEDGWETDASSNLALRDALLGGMITEIAALADM